MRISRDWLQTFFDTPLPDAVALADALTFHVFEIESVDSSDGLGAGNDVLDVKVTANRGHDCLSHRGIAKELSAILQLSMKNDPLRGSADLTPTTEAVSVSIEEPTLCRRYIAGYIRGVKVGPSPEWLVQYLESISQRSINNVVDATNYVMFNLGQPLHAFDAGRLKNEDGFKINVRKARQGEKMLALDGKEYELQDSNLMIVDGHTDMPIGIAGVKGGAPASITETTTDIIIESANFDGVAVRKTAQALKLRTDASARYEQEISAELCAYGMRDAADLIVELAGGTVEGFAEQYPVRPEKKTASVSISKINKVLGTALHESDVSQAFTLLGLAHTQSGEVFEVHVPFERLDLESAEDLVEEVGRIVGYDKVPEAPLPSVSDKPEVHANFARAETIREHLMASGYSEVYTSVFADTGVRAVANKIGGEKPYLRADLTALKVALEKNARIKDLLGLKEVKLFEIGSVWTPDGEEIHVGSVGEKEPYEEKRLTDVTAEDIVNLPVSATERYQTFSKYPFIVRDIAFWVPAGENTEKVQEIIRQHAGDLLVRCQLFDRFEKDDRVSYAFRLVFQSVDRTLFDDDANARMESVSDALKKEGYEIR